MIRVEKLHNKTAPPPTSITTQLLSVRKNLHREVEHKKKRLGIANKLLKEPTCKI